MRGEARRGEAGREVAHRPIGRECVDGLRVRVARHCGQPAARLDVGADLCVGPMGEPQGAIRARSGAARQPYTALPGWWALGLRMAVQRWAGGGGGGEGACVCA